MTKIRQGRGRGGECEGRGGANRVLDQTYPELSVARATVVFCQITKIYQIYQKVIVILNESAVAIRQVFLVK